MAIDDMIRAAGNQLHARWFKPGGVTQMPENDLHPDGASTLFRVKLLEDRVAALEAIIRNPQNVRPR